jgi:hypothetical protein
LIREAEKAQQEIEQTKVTFIQRRIELWNLLNSPFFNWLVIIVL